MVPAALLRTWGTLAGYPDIGARHAWQAEVAVVGIDIAKNSFHAAFVLVHYAPYRMLAAWKLHGRLGQTAATVAVSFDALGQLAKVFEDLHTWVVGIEAHDAIEIPPESFAIFLGIGDHGIGLRTEMTVKCGFG